MANINVELITQSLKEGRDFTIDKIDRNTVQYIRTWAGRRGWYVYRDGNHLTVTATKRDSFRASFMKGLKSGDKFTITVPASNIRYIRTLVTNHNAENPNDKRSATLTMHKHITVVSPEGNVEFTIYPAIKK